MPAHVKYLLERHDTGAHICPTEAAKQAGLSAYGLRNLVRHAGDDWFDAGRLKLRMVTTNGKRKTATDPLRDALMRASDGLATESEVRMVQTWAARIRRESDDLAAVLAGRADVAIDGGRVCVLRLDREWRSEGWGWKPGMGGGK